MVQDEQCGNVLLLLLSINGIYTTRPRGTQQTSGFLRHFLREHVGLAEALLSILVNPR